jgi:Rab-GTPase-TBC domain
MNFITAMLLLNIKDEEEAFWCLVMILLPRDQPHPVYNIKGIHNWRMCFSPTMEKIMVLQEAMEELLREKIP